MNPTIPALVVEGESSFGELLRNAIAAVPAWGPVMAVPGDEAIELLDAGFDPKLVVLDLDAPRVSGFSVLRRLREGSRHRRTAVVVAGSGADPRDAREDWLLGEVHVEKPLQLDDLTTAIKLATARLEPADCQPV